MSRQLEPYCVSSLLSETGLCHFALRVGRSTESSSYIPDFTLMPKTLSHSSNFACNNTSPDLTVSIVKDLTEIRIQIEDVQVLLNDTAFSSLQLQQMQLNHNGTIDDLELISHSLQLLHSRLLGVEDRYVINIVTYLSLRSF